MYTTKENRLDASVQTAFFLLQISGHLSTRGLFGGFKVRYKPNCSPMSEDTPGVETSPEQRMPGKMTAPLFVKDLH